MTIKFRGKTIINGQWVYGDLHTHDCIEISVHDAYRAESYYPVYPNTVGQFTELVDKNGQEIYEGDILKYTRHNYKSGVHQKIEEIYIVFWKKSFYCHTEFDNGGGAGGLLDFEAKKNEIEVVGNRYDNPELIYE